MNKAKLVIKKKQIKDYAHLIKQGVDPFVAQLLWGRGIREISEVKKYLYAGIKDLYDATAIRNIDEVFELIYDAIINHKRIDIFGDYDVDGVTSTAIMYLTLKDFGANVGFRLPDRLTEGYGMSIKAVEELHQKGCDLIITVDNGIKSHKEIALAKQYGMKVIVLDHHTPSDTLPDGDVIVDLHIKGETYPYIDLAGCGLAFKISCYLYEQFGYGMEGLKHIDLAAIGTIADVVPLTDENRIIVKEGLNYINNPAYDRVGIVELLSCFGVELGTLGSMDIAFKVGPALNAPGRLLERGAELSLSLLLTDDADEAVDIAYQLFSTNEDRKEISRVSLEKAEEYIKDNNLLDDKVMVLFIPDVPEGVVGLVSGKITEKYNRPSLVFSEGHQYFKASARSIEKFDLYKALCTCDDLFVKYGGHPQAAGMTIEKDHAILSELRTRLNQYADTVLTDDDMVKEIFVDDVLEADEITFNLIKRLDVMEPFGQCNPKPVLYVRDYLTRKKRQKDGSWQPFLYMGANKNHLKLYGVNSEAVGFDMVSKFDELGQPKRLDIIFTLSVNSFRGRETLQLEIVDFDGAKEQTKTQTELMNAMSAALANLNVMHNQASNS